MNKIISWLESKGGFHISVAIITAVHAIARIIQINNPAKVLFDEFYYRNYGVDLINGVSFYLDHPFLANLPHAITIFIFGDNPFGWRMAVWVFGIFMVAGVAFLGYWLTNKRLIGLIAALLVSLESMLFVYGRLALAETILLTFLVWGLAFFFLSCRTSNRKQSLFFALLSGLLLAMSVSVKWYALGGFGLVGFWYLVQYLKSKGRLLPRINIIQTIFSFVVLPIIAYTVLFYPVILEVGDDFFKDSCSITEGRVSKEISVDKNFWQKFYHWHCITFYNHAFNIDRTHPYQSEWWQWPLGEGRILLHRGDGGEVIWAQPNQMIWLPGALVIIFLGLSLLKRFREIDAWLVVGALGFWLPWMFVDRLVFIYSFLPVLIFEILALSLILDRLLKNKEYWKPVIAYLALVLLMFIYQYPSLIGI